RPGRPRRTSQEDSVLKFRNLSLIALAALSSLALLANAHEGSKHKPAKVTGELVDAGCYLAHGGRGEAHAECATKCINKGMPMGVLTKQGRLFLLTFGHESTEAYDKLKGMAGKTVTVTGDALDRAGMKGIEVEEVGP